MLPSSDTEQGPEWGGGGGVSLPRPPPPPCLPAPSVFAPGAGGSHGAGPPRRNQHPAVSRCPQSQPRPVAILIVGGTHPSPPCLRGGCVGVHADTHTASLVTIFPRHRGFPGRPRHARGHAHGARDTAPAVQYWDRCAGPSVDVQLLPRTCCAHLPLLPSADGAAPCTCAIPDTHACNASHAGVRHLPRTTSGSLSAGIRAGIRPQQERAQRPVHAWPRHAPRLGHACLTPRAPTPQPALAQASLRGGVARARRRGLRFGGVASERQEAWSAMQGRCGHLRAAARPAPPELAGAWGGDGPGVAGALGGAGGRQRGSLRGAATGCPGSAPARRRTEPPRPRLALAEPPRLFRTLRAGRAMGPLQVPGTAVGGCRDTVHTLRTGIGAPGLRRRTSPGAAPRGRRHGAGCSGSPCLPSQHPGRPPSSSPRFQPLAFPGAALRHPGWLQRLRAPAGLLLLG